MKKKIKNFKIQWKFMSTRNEIKLLAILKIDLIKVAFQDGND